MIKNKQAFTFVELIVSTVIIVVLTSIGFISYIDFISDSRDAQRKSDLSKVTSSLKIYKQKRGYYADPGDTFFITNQSYPVVKQGKLNKDVFINTLDKLPTDPKSGVFYSYSVTMNKQEFQVAATLENGETEIAVVEGDYKTVSKNVLPTILLATENTGDLDIQTGSVHRTKFIYDGLEYNLPYTIESPNLAYSEGLDFDTLLQAAQDRNVFWQNNDYRNCTEIVEAGKSISAATVTEEYQILSSTGALTNTGCTF